MLGVSVITYSVQELPCIGRIWLLNFQRPCLKNIYVSKCEQIATVQKWNKVRHYSLVKVEWYNDNDYIIT